MPNGVLREIGNHLRKQLAIAEKTDRQVDLGLKPFAGVFSGGGKRLDYISKGRAEIKLAKA
jgi:hypothetical protein